jgi:hypothetical protein
MDRAAAALAVASRFASLEIALYKDAKRGRTIVKFDHAGPAVIRQSDGKDKDEDAWARDNE